MQGTRRAGGSGATDASYRSHPLRPAHAGHDGIGAYWSEVTPDGLVATGRDYWFLEPGAHPPYDGWGH